MLDKILGVLPSFLTSMKSIMSLKRLGGAFHLRHSHGDGDVSWAILSEGKRCTEIYSLWSTNPWDKNRPHRVLRALLHYMHCGSHVLMPSSGIIN